MDRSRKYLLCGLITCGACGKKLSLGGCATSKAYVCKNMGCYKVGRDMKRVDQIVTDVIIARLSKPDAAALFYKPDIDIRHLYEELKAKQHKLDQIAVDYADDILTRQQARTATKKIETRIDEIHREIAAASQPNTFTEFGNTTDVGAWFDQLPLARKRDLISMLCTITIHPVGRGFRGDSWQGIDIRWRVDD